MTDVADAYRAVVGRYVASFGDVSRVHADDLALIRRHLAIGSGTVLDVGCGPGHLAAFVANDGVRPIGIDPVWEFVGHARSATPDVDVAVGALPRLPVRDGAADGILAWYSLIHLAPAALGPALAELRRVAAPGSPLVVGFFDGDRVTGFAHRVAPATRWPADEMSVRLRDAGFDEIERVRRPADADTGARPHAAIVAVAR